MWVGLGLGVGMWLGLHFLTGILFKDQQKNIYPGTHLTLQNHDVGCITCRTHTKFEVFCICPGMVLGNIRLIASSLKHIHMYRHTGHWNDTTIGIQSSLRTSWKFRWLQQLVSKYKIVQVCVSLLTNWVLMGSVAPHYNWYAPVTQSQGTQHWPWAKGWW